MTLHWEGTGIEVHKVVVGPYENNVFTVRCTESGEALLIDAANEHEQLLELCRGLGVRSVVETHGPHPSDPRDPRCRIRSRGGSRGRNDAPQLRLHSRR